MNDIPKDLTITINGIKYSAPAISRIEKILYTIRSGGGGSGGGSDPVDVNDLTPEQIAELMDIINGQNP